MKIKNYFLFALLSISLAISCKKTENEQQLPAPVLSITDAEVTINVNQNTTGYPFVATFADSAPVTNEWLLDGVVVSTNNYYSFLAKTSGNYTLVYKVTNAAGSFTHTYKINVPVPIVGATPASSKYISKIFEYLPAPGQFVNETIGSQAQAEKLIGSITNFVSLGGFGGYIIFGFDHSVVNQTGYDLAIYGNPIGGTTPFSEHGIVMVSQDNNGNGLADDEWYELAGSEYAKTTTIKNYEITYTNPKAFANVPWTDNQGNSGFVLVNNFHKHNFYPLFAANQEKMTFKGTLLPSTVGKNGSLVISSPYEWGYTDSYSTGDDYKTKLYNSFDISWAVDQKGKKVALGSVDFIKIYTAQNADAGISGEISTEVKGAVDLNIR